MLRQLKRLHPHAHVNAVVSGAARSVLEHNPNVDQLTVLPRGRAGLQSMWQLTKGSWQNPYDLVIDAYARTKTAILTRLTGAPLRHGFKRRWPRNGTCYTHPIPGRSLEYAGRWRIRLLNDTRADLNDLQLDFPTSPATQQAAHEFCRQHFKRPVAALYAVASCDFRQWPLEKCAQLGQRLNAAGFQVLLLHGPGQLPQAKQVASEIGSDVIVDYTTHSLPLMKEVLSRCELFVGNDGGPRHIANAAGISTVGVIGCDQAEDWTEPHRPDQRYVTRHLDRTPQGYFGIATESPSLEDIPVDAVWQQVETLLAEGWVNIKPSRVAA